MFQDLMIKGLIGTILLGGGAVAGVAWEHRPAQPKDSFVAKWFGQGLAAQRDDYRIASELYKQAHDSKEKALTLCEKKRDDLAKAATANVTTTTTQANERGSNAWDNGYAAGRVAGRASCQKAPTDAPSADPPAVPRPDGVRDLSDSFSRGRYTPSR